MDLVDTGISQWLADAMQQQRRYNNNNINKPKRTPPQHDTKRVDIEITPQQPEKIVNGKITGDFI